jgi:hypothetical protein
MYTHHQLIAVTPFQLNFQLSTAIHSQDNLSSVHHQQPMVKVHLGKMDSHPVERQVQHMYDQQFLVDSGEKHLGNLLDNPSDM